MQDTGRALTELSFEDWVAHVFDHPGSGREWHFDPAADYWDGPAATTVGYLARLFEAPRPLLDAYSDAELNRGFWYLLGSGGDEMHALLAAEVPLEARLACVRAIGTLFEGLFAARCSARLSHLDEAGTTPLNSACYMWWDLFPTWGNPKAPEQAALDGELLSVMARILEIPHAACRESALHGLGHWHLNHPTEVEAIVGGFLETTADLRPELRDYARAARGGCVN
jgi:hypothetical protein